MARIELVSFIQNQLRLGRDARTIRNYLVRRNIDPQEVDEAFDAAYKSNQKVVAENSKHKHVVTGLVLLILLFTGIGVSFFIRGDSTTPPELQTPSPIINTDPDPTSLAEEQMRANCDFEDTEKKYDCYLEKFKNDEIKCHEIEEDEERDFCYLAQDLYILSA